MITSIRESDHGSYQCRAENEIDSLDAVAELIVQGIYSRCPREVFRYYPAVILKYDSSIYFDLQFRQGL